MFVIFDLDGTLANIEHRLHHINKSQGKKPDWDSFHKACINDMPIWETIRVLNALHAVGHYIEIWSGRSDMVREETETWLANHGIQYHKLMMRFHGDYTPDHELKRSWLRLVRANNQYPQLVFDDRSRLVQMWRDEQLICCQVAPGEF
jgi:FMN phosphatase YigB (HAD superfamily)